MKIDDKNLNKGATMIEYALITGLIAIVAIGAMKSVGSVLTTKIEKVSTTLESEEEEKTEVCCDRGLPIGHSGPCK